MYRVRHGDDVYVCRTVALESTDWEPTFRSAVTGEQNYFPPEHTAVLTGITSVNGLPIEITATEHRMPVTETIIITKREGAPLCTE